MRNTKTNINPLDKRRWDAMRAEHHARHAAGIAYVRGQVEPGTEYANEVARAVISPSGAYFELRELPEEFVGAVGDGVAHRLLGAGDAHLLLRRIQGLVDDIAQGRWTPRAFTLYLLYPGSSVRAQKGLFVFDYQRPAGTPFTVGAWQGVLPRALKLRLHLDADQTPPPDLPQSGIVLLLAPTPTDGGQCLVATITRTADTQDLSGMGTNPNLAN